MENACLILKLEADSTYVYVVFHNSPGKIQQNYLKKFHNLAFLHQSSKIAL
jgi:hypothetical protein